MKTNDRISKVLACLLVVGLLTVALAPTALAQSSIQLRGLVDIVANNDDQLRSLNSTNMRDSNFDPLRARLFVDGGNENTQFFLQMLFSEESFDDLRLFGAYLTHKLFDSREMYMQAGLIPNPTGIWASYTYSNKNPLVGIPLAYIYRSTLPSRQMPNDLDDLLDHRGQGQGGYQLHRCGRPPRGFVPNDAGHVRQLLALRRAGDGNRGQV